MHRDHCCDWEEKTQNLKQTRYWANGMKEVQLRLEKIDVAFQETVELRWEKMRM